MTDQEIDAVLGDVTKTQMAAALAAINGYGFDISAPWECSQDDREFEMFCGVLAVVAAVLALDKSRPKSNGVIPCYKGGHICNWPACSLDCDGRP